jgi:hypothetical protein
VFLGFCFIIGFTPVYLYAGRVGRTTIGKGTIIYIYADDILLYGHKLVPVLFLKQKACMWASHPFEETALPCIWITTMPMFVGSDSHLTSRSTLHGRKVFSSYTGAGGGRQLTT